MAVVEIPTWFWITADLPRVRKERWCGVQTSALRKSIQSLIRTHQHTSISQMGLAEIRMWLGIQVDLWPILGARRLMWTLSVRWGSRITLRWDRQVIGGEALMAQTTLTGCVQKTKWPLASKSPSNVSLPTDSLPTSIQQESENPRPLIAGGTQQTN